MSNPGQILSRLIRCKPDTRRDALVMVIVLVKVQLLVWLLPPRAYFANYFSEREPRIHDIQLFREKVRLFRRIMRVFPYRVTCLVSSLALFEVLRKHGMINPIYIGVRMKGRIDAHAWNWHQAVQGYKKLEL